MGVIAERASAGITSLPASERPISEQFRIIARQFADVDAAANILEGTKRDVLESIKSRIVAGSDMPDNKAERLARCSDEWKEFKASMLENRNKATRLKLQLEFIRMKFSEQLDANANARRERGM
jgi:hypothetical protein